MRDTILCLCDLTGVMARPWVEHGYHAVLVDPQHGVTSEDGAYLILFFVLFFAFVAYLGWAEETADTIILRDGSRSYVCQTSRISQAPHNCKPVKEKS